MVENVSFSSNSPEAKPPVIDQVMEQAKSLARSQPNMGKTAIFGLCAILLVLCVLRPMAKQVVATLREPGLLSAGSGNELSEMQPGLPMSEEMNPFVLPSKTKEQLQHQGVFERVADHIRREPVQSTRLLEAWIGASEEMD